MVFKLGIAIDIVSVRSEFNRLESNLIGGISRKSCNYSCLAGIPVLEVSVNSDRLRWNLAFTFITTVIVCGR